MSTGIRPLIAGNWKMNGVRSSLSEIREMASSAEEHVDLLVCVPFTLLSQAAEIAGPVAIGAQDCHPLASGPHTGDISAGMAADAGANWIIVGHSERRTDHHEGDDLVRAKAEAVLEAGLRPIICIGESQDERGADATLAVLERQLDGSLPEAADIVVAYEPIWAIGTGVTATPGDVKEVHEFLRGYLENRFGSRGASIRLLYGGSVKPDNAAELLCLQNVNGALIGGASLKASDFLAIAKACPN